MAIDKCGRARCRRRPQRGAGLRDFEQAISGDRIGFAFEAERPDGLDPHVALRQPGGILAQQYRCRVGGVLEAGGDIGGIADRRVVHRQLFADRAKHHRPGMNPHTHGQIHFVGLGCICCPAEDSLDRQGGQQGALHVVFLGHRSAEQRHEPVPGELRRHSAVTVHLGKAGRQKRAHEIAHRLGSETLGQRRRPYDVAKQDGDLLQFAGETAPGVSSSGNARFGKIGPRRSQIRPPGLVERCSALAAEFVFRWVASAA